MKMLEGPHRPVHLPNPSMENNSAQDLEIAVTFVNETEEALNLGQPHHLLESGEVQEV